MTKTKPHWIRIVWVVVKVVVKHFAKAIAKFLRKYRWPLSLIPTALLVYAAFKGFKWTRVNGADGGDVLSFMGGAFGAGLAVAGARWLSFSAERRQHNQDKTAILLTLAMAMKTWEIALRRDVSSPPNDLHSEGLLRQCCEWSAKILFLIEGEAGKRQGADLAKANAFFSLSMSLKRNLSFFDEINQTPYYVGFHGEQITDKLDKLWFVLYDVIRPAYSALDRYIPGSWKPEAILDLARRSPGMSINLAKRKGQEVDVDAIRAAASGISDDAAWDKVMNFFEEWKK